jgi:hypothetical protein
MKKLFLLLACGAVATASNAQHMKFKTPGVQNAVSRDVLAPPPTQVLHKKSLNPQPKTAAKTTASTFWGPETFASGTSSTLPTGWTAASMPTAGGGTWKWANTASTSTFTMGAMMSTSASDGWMIFDSDLIGAVSGGTPSGYLQTPLITACATAASVRLNFENYFRNFYDSCSVWVSSDPSFASGTYHVYPVYYNNTTPVNVSTPNPSDVHINISSMAAMNATVYIRFVYYGYMGGSYSWMIDDITLSDMDPVDAAVNKASVVYYSGAANAFAAFGTKPAKMMDTVYPVAFVTNFGSTGFPTTSVNAKIFQGGTSVYDQDVVVDMPVDAVDTIAEFTGVGSPAGYFSTVQGGYTVPFSVALSGDAVTTNDRDTTGFIVTDTSWSENAPGSNLTGGAYIYRQSTAPLMSFSPATGFVVSANRVDTLTSISVAFDDATAAGQKVGLQIYHFDGSGWIYDGVTQFKALAAEDISTASSIVYTTFVVDMEATGGHIVLYGGTDGTNYAAVLKGQGNTADVLVLQGTPPAAYNIVGYVGMSDTSFNDGAGSQQFGQDGLPYGNASVPLITLNFGKVPVVGVQNINRPEVVFGKAYPNPANSQVNIPVTMTNNGFVTISLTNAIGQTISTQTLYVNAGRQTNVSFATSNLPSGVYLYTATVDGRQTTGRVSITH